LEQRRQLLGLEQTGDEAARTVELDQTRQGRLSRMDALQGQAMSLEAKRRRQLQLQKIAGALARMDNGEYGYCVRCGEAIARDRLKLDPAAPLCIACASESDANA
jgi:DnaK suppressor protein